MGHAGLVSKEARQMDRFGSIVLGEGLDASTVGAGALLGVETHGAMAGSGKLTVRLEKKEKDAIFSTTNNKKQTQALAESQHKAVSKDLNLFYLEKNLQSLLSKKFLGNQK